MPPLVIAAGITSAGLLGGAALASRASNKATQASSEANKQALDFTRQQEVTRRADYEKAQFGYEKQWNAWNAQRMALLQRYGVDVSGMQPAPTVLSRGMPPTARTNAVTQGKTIADILTARENEQRPWNEWERYGLRSA